MDTTIGNGDDTARLKVMFKVRKIGPDPEGLSRWDVFEKRYLIIEVLLGTMIAGSRDNATAKARAMWPHVKRISVSPSED